jgi:hypothetical protein
LFRRSFIWLKGQKWDHVVHLHVVVLGNAKYYNSRQRDKILVSPLGNGSAEIEIYMATKTRL